MTNPHSIASDLGERTNFAMVWRSTESLKIFVFLLALSATESLTNSQATCKTPWQYCGTSGSTNGISVDAVTVGNCCSLPCYLTNGENVSVDVVFTAEESYESLVLKLCGQLYGSCIDFPLEYSNVCNYVSCPLQFGAQYRMKLNVFIKSYWQNVSATAKWILEDADEVQKVCFKLPVVIKNSSKKPEYTPEAAVPKKAPPTFRNDSRPVIV